MSQLYCNPEIWDKIAWTRLPRIGRFGQEGSIIEFYERGCSIVRTVCYARPSRRSKFSNPRVYTPCPANIVQCLFTVCRHTAQDLGRSVCCRSGLPDRPKVSKHGQYWPDTLYIRYCATPTQTSKMVILRQGYAAD